LCFANKGKNLTNIVLKCADCPELPVTDSKGVIHMIHCSEYYTLSPEMKEKFQEEVSKYCATSANPDACVKRYADLIVTTGPSPAPTSSSSAAPAKSGVPKPT
jgi:hypothetical protein